MTGAGNTVRVPPPVELLGQKIARRLLLGAFALAFAGLAGGAVFVFLKKPHIAYSATSRLATAAPI